MELIRIGEKIICKQKIFRVVEKILQKRHNGHSQQEVARQLNLDRSFISRLEVIGEVRKGKKIAIFGFPLKNLEEIEAIARLAGVEYTFLMNNKQRWNFIKDKSGIEFFNQVMKILSDLRQFETVILIGSSKWLDLAEALLDSQIIFIYLGASPIDKDCYLEPDKIKQVLNSLVVDNQQKGGTVNEENSKCKSRILPSQ